MAFFFSSRRRHTRCALVTGVQTCALPICEMREDGMRLSPSPQPGQVEMHADDAKIDAADAHLGHHRAARLQRGQVDDFLMDDLDRLSDQQRVAMPAEAAASRLEGHGLVVAMLLEHVDWQRAHPRPEASIRFLKRADLGQALAHHLTPTYPQPP